MANFLLTQTGEEVQTILNEAPETKEGLQQEVTNREQAITAEEQARNEAIAAAIEAAIVNYYTKTETDTKLSAYSTTTEMQQAIQTAITAALTAYSTTQDMNTAIATALGDYYTKAEVTAIASLIDDHISALASRVSDIENGETPAKLAENLESWAERGETPQNNEWTDKVRTTAGDMSIDSSRTSRLLSVIPLSPFYAQSLRATGFNLLHGAQAAGSGYYFEVPALTFGMINTAEENNGVLFTNQHGDNLRPTVYFKPLAEGVPQHANDGVVADYRDEGGYRFYLCSEPGYIIVSNITLEDTCAHIAWSRRYNEFISPDNAEDAGSSLPLALLIHAIHDYDLMLRAEMGEQYVYDELRANNGNVNWFRRVERIQPEWTTADNGDGTYTHTATIAGMKANGIAECGSLALTVSGTTIAYTDDSSAPTGDYVLYQLSEPVSGIVEQDNAFSVEDWGLEILVDAQGDALITTQYYQSLPDAIAALLTKVPGLRTDLTEEINRRVAEVVALQREINTEKNRAEGAEQTLQGNIDAEAQARQQTDTVLDGKIADEKTRAEGAEQTLQGNIDDEETRAKGAEQTLQGNIDSEQTTRENADAAINAKIPQTASAQNLLVDRQYLAEQIAAEVQARMGADADLQALIDAIVAKIPAAATAQNQLADKAFVNSSIASNTGSLVTDNGQPFTSVSDLEAYSGTLYNNDYAFVVTTDQQGNTIYNRYKYNATSGQWVFEYALNNSSFTAAQFAAINSGITAELVSKLGDLPNATDLATQISTAITNALVSYYTKSEIDTTLAGYYTKTQIDTLIANYSTTTQMNTAISDAIATALADYYTKTQIDTLIADYSTTAQMTTAITNALASYYTKSNIDTLIADYSTTQQMTTAISQAIASALASYSTTQQMNAAISTALTPYYTKTEIDTILAGYVQTGTFNSHTGNTTVHITAAEHEKLDALPTNAELNTKFYALTRHTRLTDFDLNVLKQAVADQNLEKYGLKVGDQKTINGHTYVIAGLNPMKGTTTPYRVTANHVGLIVIPHTTHVWNADGKTTAVDGGHGAGYMNSELHAYLKSDILPMCNTDLGAANLIGHSKLLTNAVNANGINRYGEATGCSSGWTWEADCKICALSEVQVYGSIVWSSSGFDTGEACRQLDVFQAYSHTEIFGGEYPWLRDVVSASRAAYAGRAGDAGLDAASIAAYVAALILFH